jgi:hypothetical protein
MDDDESLINEETEYVSAGIRDSGARPGFYEVMHMLLTVQGQVELAGRAADWSSIQIDFDEDTERWMLTVLLEPVGY